MAAGIRPRSRTAAWLLVLLVATSCAQRAVPTGTSAPPTASAGPATRVFLSALYAPGPNADGVFAAASEGTCTGSATITIDPEPRGVLLLATARFEMEIRGCPPGTTLTDVHLHQGPCCPVDAWIGSGLGVTALPSGGARLSSVNPGVAVSRAEAVIARPADYYLHFHSRNNPVGGFLRGELTPK